MLPDDVEEGGSEGSSSDLDEGSNEDASTDDAQDGSSEGTSSDEDLDLD